MDLYDNDILLGGHDYEAFLYSLNDYSNDSDSDDESHHIRKGKKIKQTKIMLASKTLEERDDLDDIYLVNKQSISHGESDSDKDNKSEASDHPSQSTSDSSSISDGSSTTQESEHTKHDIDDKVDYMIDIMDEKDKDDLSDAEMNEIYDVKKNKTKKKYKGGGGPDEEEPMGDVEPTGDKDDGQPMMGPMMGPMGDDNHGDEPPILPLTDYDKVNDKSVVDKVDYNGIDTDTAEPIGGRGDSPIYERPNESREGTPAILREHEDDSEDKPDSEDKHKDKHESESDSEPEYYGGKKDQKYESKTTRQDNVVVVVEPDEPNKPDTIETPKQENGIIAGTEMKFGGALLDFLSA